MVTTIEDVFKAGDLIYGLAWDRRIFWGRVHAYRHDVREAIIIDEITPELIGLPRCQVWRFPLLGLPIARFRWFPKYDPEKQFKKPSISAFKEFMEAHPRYDPRTTPRGNERDYETRLRRECKAAILFTVSRGNKIHFVLDGLDMDRVVDKSGSGDYIKKGTKFRDITGAELRIIYRFRHDPTVMNNIIFWVGLQQVPPPWLTSPKTWLRYHPKSETQKEA